MSGPAAALRDARAVAQDRLAAARRVLRDVLDSASSTTGDDEHDPEGATIGFERAQAQAMVDVAAERLAELDAALERATSGGYGICESCGGPIGADRLAARPSARHCITCARGR